MEHRDVIREALRRLGVDRFVVGVFETALPSAPGRELGCGSLATTGGRAFLELAAEVGFNAVQLGPTGMTDRGNPSPYDGTLFSRTLLALDLESLTGDQHWGGLLSDQMLEAIARSLPPTAAERTPYAWAWQSRRSVLGQIGSELRRRSEVPALADLRERLRRFATDGWWWLEGDCLYEALVRLHGSEDWRRWSDPLDRRLFEPPVGSESAARARRRQLAASSGDVVEDWCLGQMILHEQRQQARSDARRRKLALYGDVQVGMSLRDMWRWRELLLAGYRLGAPPSRTNPEGQPWSYPVLDPERYFADGSSPGRWPIGRTAAAEGDGLRFVLARFRRAFVEYDALRIDHPHGLVCPWVYRADADDPGAAVRAGARLFGSPAEPDHPELARYAIARSEQVRADTDRWADDRIADLDEDQVSRYAVLLDRVVAAARDRGLGPEALVCEVLSTVPAPLAGVVERYGIGRFRVTQKATTDNPADVYAPANARERDWVMLGTHDTPPIRAVVERWRREGQLRDRAASVARSLADGPTRELLRERLVGGPMDLATGMLAELLASRARNVMVFFTDLLGMSEPFNRPGLVDSRNWTLRVPPDARRRLLERGEGLDVPEACALALESRRDLADNDLIGRLRDVSARHRR